MDAVVQVVQQPEPRPRPGIVPCPFADVTAVVAGARRADRLTAVDIEGVAEDIGPVPGQRRAVTLPAVGVAAGDRREPGDAAAPTTPWARRSGRRARQQQTGMLQER